MIHLTPNAASNRVYISPFEARKFLSAFTHYLLIFKNNATEKEHPCVLVLLDDNERYTRADIATNNNNPSGGSVLITESGLYTYTIYGQNSATNTDPEDASVVGVCEVGPCRVSAEAAWTIPEVTIPDNVIYYE